jgi:hypothetical protein
MTAAPPTLAGPAHADLDTASRASARAKLSESSGLCRLRDCEGANAFEWDCRPVNAFKFADRKTQTSRAAAWLSASARSLRKKDLRNSWRGATARPGWHSLSAASEPESRSDQAGAAAAAHRRRPRPLISQAHSIGQWWISR